MKYRFGFVEADQRCDFWRCFRKSVVMLLPEIEHECYTPVALARQALELLAKSPLDDGTRQARSSTFPVST